MIGCTQNPALANMKTVYIAFLAANYQSIASSTALLTLPMVRRIKSDGNKRIVFNSYDEVYVGVFIFLLNIPPYTYDQTIIFPKHPGHLVKFSQNISCDFINSSLCYTASRAGQNIFYRYDLNNPTKLDYGTVF